MYLLWCGVWMLVFWRVDVTNYSTFQNLPRWVKKLQQETDKNCSIVIIGNKSMCLILTAIYAVDLVEADPSLRKVELSEVLEYAKSLDAKVFEVSSKSGKNIQESFQQVVKSFGERNQVPSSPKVSSGTVRLDKKPANANKSCC